MSKTEDYRDVLRTLDDWVPFLKKNSGLPGPRGNLELAYCWSVAVAAFPEEGKPLMEKWFDSEDKDIRWMVKENLKKNRLVKMDADWVMRSLKKLNRFNGMSS